MPERKRAARHAPRAAVILAAGKGTRFHSLRPKVLHPAGGRPLLQWVVDAAREAGCERTLLVVGHGAREIRGAVRGDDLVWVEQREQKGTGHALAQVESHVTGDADLLVLSGDAPLVRAESLERLAAAAAGGWGAMAVAELTEPGYLGRVVTDARDRLVRTIEVVDASPQEVALTQVNAGAYVLPAPEIFRFLDGVKPDNVKGEFYLTDALSAAAAEGREVICLPLDDPSEAWGVNDRGDLARVHRRLLARRARELMTSGVTILDPERTVVEPGVEVGRDTVIHAGVTLLGRTVIGERCALHTGAWVRDSVLGEGVSVEPYTVLDGAEVGDACRVGPFARLRPESVLEPRVRIGNFVEVKKSRLGEGAKANHLAYVGDASVGEDANLGAGVITCNYDGVRKHPTEIGARAFIGSDTMLIAPVKVGRGAHTAAGSVITKDVPAESLGVARARQRTILGWVKRRLRQMKTGD